MADYYQRNRERLLKQAKEYRETHKEEIKASKADWVRRNPDWYTRRRGEITARMRGYSRAVRLEMVEAYGGQCVCCGIDDHRVLTLDHEFKDGAAHRRALGTTAGLKFYIQLRKLGWPQDRGLRLLCANCHRVEDQFGGCTHDNPNTLIGACSRIP